MNFYVFSIARIPVHLSVWALLLVAWLAWRMGDPVLGAMMGLGALISVLIHELGHAVVAARYGLQPAILLHALGGVTQHTPARTDAQDAWIIAAGPLIQLAAGAVVLVGWVLGAAIAPAIAGHPMVSSFLFAFLYVSLFWGLINLAPMWPLDGGKLFRLGLIHLLSVKPLLADRITHITGIALAIVAFLLFWLFIGGFLLLVLLIFGMVAFQNVMALREDRGAGPVRRQSKHARSLLTEARAAFERRDWREAARLGHQIRAEPEVPERILSETFEIIALAHIFDGALDEGVRFARRAPPTSSVVSAWVQALVELDRLDEARAVLRDHADGLPSTLRAELEARLAS